MKKDFKKIKKTSALFLVLAILTGALIPSLNIDIGAVNSSDYGVAVSARASTTSYQTFTNPRNSTSPGEFMVYLDVTIEEEGVTGGYIDVPLTYQTPSTYTDPGVGDFFIYNQSKTEAAFGNYVDSSSIENIDGVDVIRIYLNDNLMQGSQTLVLYFNFNTAYNGKVAFGETLWNINATSYANDDSDVIQKSDEATMITVKSSGSNSLTVGATNLSHPSGEWAEGTINQRLSWTYQQSYENLMNDSGTNYLYFDVPKGSTVTNASSNSFVYNSTYTDSGTGVEYDRYIKTVTSTIGWNSLNFNGNTGYKFLQIDFSIIVPTGYVTGDSFTIKRGINLDLINTGVVTKESSVIYNVVDEKDWDFYAPTALGHSTGDTLIYTHVDVGDGMTDHYAVATSGKAQTYVSLGWTAYNHSSSFKNTGTTKTVEGTSLVLENNNTDSAKINFGKVRVVAFRKDNSKTWNQYKMTYYFDDGSTHVETVTPTTTANLQTLEFTPPTQSWDTKYITKIVVDAMGNDASDENNKGDLLSGNGFSLGYIAKSWPDKKWPDGTIITESKGVPMDAVYSWLSEDGATVNTRENTSKVANYYVVDESIYPTVSISGNSLTGRFPSDTLDMIISAKVDVSRGPDTKWDSPYVVARIPKELELVSGTGTTLTDTITTTNYGVTVTLVSSDTKYNYYAFQSESGYSAPTTSSASSFTIPFQLKIKDGTSVGTYSIDSVVMTSYGTSGELKKSFDVIDVLAKNNLPSGQSLSSYGLSSGDKYRYATNSCNITVVRKSDMQANTHIKSSLTNDTYVTSSIVAAEHNTDVTMKLSITNNGNVDLKDLKLYDVLPQDGDARGSSGGTTLKSVSVSGASPTIYYTDSTTPAALGTALQGFVTTGWSTNAADATGATAFYVDFGSLIVEPGDTIEVILSFAVPGPVGTDQTAYNQFAYSAKTTSNDGQIDLVAPIKGFTTESKTIQYEKNTPSTIVSGSEVENFPEYAFVTKTGNDDETATITSTIPTLTGYTFKEWNTKANGTGDSYKDGDTESFGSESTLTFYAIWTANEYAINYDLDDGIHLGNPTTYTFGTGVSSFTDAWKLNHRFDGWYTDASFTTKITDISNTSTGVVNLYAKFVPQYTVTYDGKNNTSGAVPTDITKYETDDTITVQDNTGDLKRTGYTFKGWTTTSDGSGTVYNIGDTITVTNANVTLYAKWQANEYDITYELDGGTNDSSNPSKYTYAVGVTSFENPTKDNFRFDGWYDDDDFATATKITNISTTKTGEVTLYAKWVKQYNVSYDDNDSTSGTVPTDPTKYETGNSVIVKGNTGTLAKTGHTFKGWTTASDGSGTVYEAGNTITVASSNITLYTKWEANKYDVIYELDGGTNDSTNPSKYTYGIGVTSFEEPTKTGHTFKGWYDTVTFDNEITDISTTQLGAVTLYAKWEVNKYDIIYELDGGVNDSANPVKYTYGVGVTSFENPTKEGHTFKGWYDTATFANEITDISITQLGAVTLYAKWEVNDYDVIYELDGGDNHTSNPSTYTYGVGVTAFEEATKEGHTFKGWYDNAACVNEITDISSTKTGVVTLYAKWEVNDYTINYHLDGGNNSNNNPSSYTYGIGVSSFEEATREGYTFLGWYDSALIAGTLVTDISDTSIGEVDLYAKWVPNKYAINYELDGGVNHKDNPNEYTYGIGVISFNNPTKEGYVFDGWYTVARTSTQITSISDTNIGDVTLYARWTPSTNVTYRVEHYKEQKNGSYELADTDTLKGTTGSIVTANAKTYEGYKLDKEVQETIESGEVAADGTLVLKLYYKQDKGLTMTTKPSVAARPSTGVGVDTADMTNPIVYIGMMLVSLLSLFHVTNRRKKLNK